MSFEQLILLNASVPSFKKKKDKDEDEKPKDLTSILANVPVTE